MCILKDFIILGKNITMKILKFPVHFQFIWYKIIHLFWFGVSEIFIFIMVWSVSHKKETLHVTSQYPFEKWDVHSWRCRYPVLLYPVFNHCIPAQSRTFEIRLSHNNTALTEKMRFNNVMLTLIRYKIMLFKFKLLMIQKLKLKLMLLHSLVNKVTCTEQD